MIEIQNFTKNYYDFLQKKPSFTVENISMKFDDGNITALIGPNGSGKTTILKAICGFHNPSTGKINVTDKNNQILDSQENSDLIMENIGYVPEISILPPDLKVLDFLYYAASIHKETLQNQKQAVENVISKCELSKVLNKKIKTLSKGYKQRISFAQAIIHNPKNLILDEPITGLDPAQIVQMRTLIKQLAEDKAVLISTHILQEVTSLCSKVYIINNGKLITEGTEEEIKAEQKTQTFEEAFIKLTSEK